MVHGVLLSYSGKQACIVISHHAGSVTAISLYSPDSATYDHYAAVIKMEEQAYGLANKDPSDHEDIHSEMGRLMGRDSESTKTHNTHFHWVGGKPLSLEQFGGLLQRLVKTKVLSRPQMTAILQVLSA
ncbi:hypothetical protein [Hyalangium versicolor]|uniref:hypothetical protein n=1 Tax=Hyalangium versicolor TaxID=2861190 RepID=UPI001CCA7E4D|nr:hypothetical protein [Hyalangium versicolor]